MPRLGALLIVFVATALPFAAQESAPVFDVASIKRNIGPMPSTSGTIANTPRGEIRMVWIPARLLVLLAYQWRLLPKSKVCHRGPIQNVTT